MLALLLKLVRMAFGPERVVVGADGIVVERARGNHFVPHDRLASVAVKHDAVELTLTDGSRVRVRRVTAVDDRVIDFAPGIDPASLRGGARFGYRRDGVLVTPPAAP